MWTLTTKTQDGELLYSAQCECIPYHTGWTSVLQMYQHTTAETRCSTPTPCVYNVAQLYQFHVLVDMNFKSNVTAVKPAIEPYWHRVTFMPKKYQKKGLPKPYQEQALAKRYLAQFVKTIAGA